MVYKYLEPLYNDYRKIAYRGMGGWEIKHIDEFVDSLLNDELVCDVTLPYLQKRSKIESLGLIEPRRSALEDDMDDDEEVNSEESGEVLESETPQQSSNRAKSSDQHVSHAAPINSQQNPTTETCTDTKGRDMDVNNERSSRDRDDSEKSSHLIEKRNPDDRATRESETSDRKKHSHGNSRDREKHRRSHSRSPSDRRDGRSSHRKDIRRHSRHSESKSRSRSRDRHKKSSKHRDSMSDSDSYSGEKRKRRKRSLSREDDRYSKDKSHSRRSRSRSYDRRIDRRERTNNRYSRYTDCYSY